MKKLFLLMFTIATAFASAQTTDVYISGGLSMTNGEDFKNNNYASLEAGICKNEMGFGAVFGRSFLDGAFRKDDIIGNYFWELKTSYTKDFGKSTKFYFLLGYGGYFSSSRYFIEYGGGFSYSLSPKFSLFLQYSNWDKVNFVTPGFSYTLN